MTDTIVVLLIATVAFVLSLRWFYRTLAGKSEGCGCGDSGCPTMASTNSGDEKKHCKEA